MTAAAGRAVDVAAAAGVGGCARRRDGARHRDRGHARRPERPGVEKQRARGRCPRQRRRRGEPRSRRNCRRIRGSHPVGGWCACAARRGGAAWRRGSVAAWRRRPSRHPTARLVLGVHRVVVFVPRREAQERSSLEQRKRSEETNTQSITDQEEKKDAKKNGEPETMKTETKTTTRQQDVQKKKRVRENQHGTKVV